MSKPISFGFGKAKGSSTPSTSTKTSISLVQKTIGTTKPSKKVSALHDDDDDLHDEEEPKHEELTGFSSGGAILSKPVEEKKLLVIENAGNLDWRRKARGKNILPAEVQSAQNGQHGILVEKDEVTKATGLQFAEREPEREYATESPSVVGHVVAEKPKSADEEALQALLASDDSAPKGTAIIQAQADTKFGAKEEDAADLRDLTQAYPESSTLEDYAAMPVEEFGMAMLRGMGKKRRANGEVIQLESPEKKKEPKRREQGSFLGIGAKAAPGMEGVEIGAWGKADMRKNNKGAGFFTPIMVRDSKTGEIITEEELESRKRVAKSRESDGKQQKDRAGERLPQESYERTHRRRSRSRSRDRRKYDDDRSRHKSSSSRKDQDRERDRSRDRDRHSRRDKYSDRGERRYRV